jgi:rRNA-processing protein FCF1
VPVIEGAARGVTGVPGVEVVSAPGSGDDTIASLAKPQAADEHRVVVTADRELRARCEAEGVTVVGPAGSSTRFAVPVRLRACLRSLGMSA